MKKLLLTSLLALLASTGFAKNTRNNEIAVSYGFSTGQFAYAMMTVIGQELFGEDLPEVSGSGSFSLEYFRRLGDLVSVGAGMAYYKVTTTADGTKSVENSFAILPSVKFHWYQREWFSAYSKLGAGAVIDKEDAETSLKFGMQASLLGLEVGRTVRVFAEGGIGQQGFLLGGLRVRF